jgi:hypothetical protein
MDDDVIMLVMRGIVKITTRNLLGTYDLIDLLRCFVGRVTEVAVVIKTALLIFLIIGDLIDLLRCFVRRVTEVAVVTKVTALVRCKNLIPYRCRG